MCQMSYMCRVNKFTQMFQCARWHNKMCSGTGKQQIYSQPPHLPPVCHLAFLSHDLRPTPFAISAAALIQLSLTNTRQIPLESRIANMFGLNFICIDSPMHRGQQGVTLERSWLIANGAKK